MRPLLSVVIPTHNRAKYATHAIRSILSIDDARLELVVTDTSTDNLLERELSGEMSMISSDTRFKYYRPSEPLDMTANHNAAVGYATGQYVCLIGDDDSVTRDVLNAAQWADQQGIDLIAPNVVANYAWPDFRSRFFGAGHAGRLYLPRKLSPLSIRRSENALRAALQEAAQGTDGLPKIYHGIVHRSLLETIKSRSGAYFHGSSPDVSGAIGLALVSKQFVVVDYPLTIPGASGGSNTGRSAMNKHKGDLDDPQTKGFMQSGWSDGVPRFFSVETVWAHAALETIRRLNPHLIGEYNFSKLLGVCWATHPEYRVEIDRVITQIAESGGLVESDLRAKVGKEKQGFQFSRFKRLARRLLNPTAAGGRLFKDNIDTVSASVCALERYMCEQGWSWDGYISRNDNKALFKSH